ncbi:YhgE/Pip family protein [Stackebrandtia nassauensis]|uniref:YhgE/Pip N-terminal domain protein n=1 Tax=Stackebrandtia nassauensis (strain DSM 44728 / CIP 108903 / NRRL B-16338 / NBRC 102104 / LLR-40K-21) TaxID=446470 RepID=D3PUI0_STANL|nr:YhgE/Pip family protein [Stackebrandtia nassauensis]ADD42993.1 YhgE/Pip N-terminal domain protein [Stackebrandtia nassauensis DSM 44728]
MFTPFADSARAIASGPLTWKTWTGLIVLPLLVMGSLTWALSAIDADHGTATAAVVNNDKPVKVKGQTIPLGRELAGDLTHNDDSSYDWVLTDAEDAKTGLAEGEYAAVVTIPENFSARGTSAATAEPLDADRAILEVETTDAAGVADPMVSEDVALSTTRSLDKQVVETYLDNVYIAFNTIHDKLEQAATGANRLADGTGELKSGAAKLSDGADTLADATGKLKSGAGELAGGLGDAESATAKLPELTKQLAEGADKVADGNEKLADTVVPLANKIIKAIDALPSATDAADKFQKFAARCDANGGNAKFCDDLQKAADTFSDNASAIDEGIDSVRSNVVDTRDAIKKLAAGARKVADGNAKLAEKAAPLAEGIADAADGARQLSGGASKIDKGAGQLSSGADRLSDGASQVDEGARELAEGLLSGLDAIPNYTDEERDHLKTVAADPTAATMNGTPFNTLSITLFAALALWALALAVYIVTRAVPGQILTSREPSWRIIIRAALPGACAAALAALAITAIAWPVLELSPARALTFGAVALLAALAFTVVNQAAVAIFGRAGRMASLAVLVLTAALGIVSTVPSPLYDLAGYLPTHGAIIALRAAASGGAGLTEGVTQLAVWLGIGAVAAVIVTDRRRYLSPRRLRLAQT